MLNDRHTRECSVHHGELSLHPVVFETGVCTVVAWLQFYSTKITHRELLVTTCTASQPVVSVIQSTEDARLYSKLLKCYTFCDQV